MDNQSKSLPITSSNWRKPPSTPQTSAYKPPTQYRSPAWLRYNTGPEITTIVEDGLIPDATQVDSSSAFEILCSYNWQDVAHPTIYVPGAPPKWKEPKLPVTLPEDKAGRYIDQNAHRCPTYPFEPMFRAMQVMNPEFDFGEIDVITNRNSMRKLLDFVSGKPLSPFRIDLDMVHNTLVLTRRERFNKEAVNDSRGNLGYGIHFEHEFTTHQKGLEASSGHHRVARYKLGDLDVAVRYEVDAHIAEDGHDTDGVEKASITTKNANKVQDDLLSSLVGLSLGTKDNEEKGKQTPANCDVKVVPQGIEIDKRRVAELKTKSKPPIVAHLVAQLWFGRVPFLIVGRHQNGNFEEVTVTETAEAFKNFETRQQDRLRKLVHLIKLLKQATMSSPQKACVVIYEPRIKPVQLSIMGVKHKKPILPPGLLKKHWRMKGSWGTPER